MLVQCCVGMDVCVCAWCVCACGHGVNACVCGEGDMVRCA